MPTKKNTPQISPHNSRIFSATLFSRLFLATLWLTLLLFIGINTYFVVNPEQSVMRNQAVSFLKNQYNVGSHIEKAKILWNAGDNASAQREISLAETLIHKQKTSTVLGLSSTPNNLLKSWQAERVKTQKLVEYWLNITEQKPDYRDAYLHLAVLTYALGQENEAIKHLNTAKSLDPNLTVYSELERIFIHSK